MPMNLGYIELGGGGITVRVHYDIDYRPVGVDQPLVDGPNGWCLEITNDTNDPWLGEVTVAGVEDGPVFVATTNQTASDLAGFGFTTRGNIGAVSLE